MKRQKIKSAEPHTDADTRNLRPDSFYDFTEKAGPVFKTAAVFPGAFHGAQKLVSHVAMAVLDIDKIETGLLCQCCRADVVLHQPRYIIVGHHRIIGWDAELFIQQRMVVED